MNVGQRATMRHGLILAAALAAVCLGATGAAAGDADVERLEQAAFRAAVERVAPSVVRIETVGGLSRVDDVLFGTGATTGLVVDREGYIVSSALNFINRPSSILVRLSDGQLRPARLVATDHNRMFVLLKIEVDDPLPVPEIAPAGEIRVGQWAMAVGRTFEGDRPNMAVGIVSALGRIWGKAIQTDAAVSPNNYGGPLIDLRGRVLGVLVPLSPQSDSDVAGYEWYDSGIGFAIDVHQVMAVLPRLKKGDDLHSGVIGASFRGENLQMSEAVVAACHPNSPAAKVGLRPGDRIEQIDGRAIGTAADVKQQISLRYAGEKCHLVVLRDEKRLEFDVDLVAKLEPYEFAMLGILPMRDPSEKPGVVVRYVYPESPAAGAEVAAGDVLLSLAGQPIGSRNALIERTSIFHPGDEVELEVRRGTETRKLALRLGRLPEDLPPKELPPARGTPESAAGDRPEVGSVEVRVPESNTTARAYIPEGYRPDVPHGLVVWLHGPGGLDFEKLLGRWKPLCDRHDLILLAPRAADPQRWNPAEVESVPKLMEQIRSTYAVDAARVVVHGHEGGGAAACVVAFGSRDLVRAVALVDAPVAARPPENDPLHRLAFYVTTAAKSRYAAPVKQAVERMREMKIPVTLKDLGQEPRYLNDEELAELVRWIDMLDRI